MRNVIKDWNDYSDKWKKVSDHVEIIHAKVCNFQSADWVNRKNLLAPAFLTIKGYNNQKKLFDKELLSMFNMFID